MFKELPWLILSLVSPDISASHSWCTRQQMLWRCHPKERQPLATGNKQNPAAYQSKVIATKCWSPICKFAEMETSSENIYLAPIVCKILCWDTMERETCLTRSLCFSGQMDNKQFKDEDKSRCGECYGEQKQIMNKKGLEEGRSMNVQKFKEAWPLMGWRQD